MKIAIDFDDTITHKGIYPITGRINQSAISYIKKLQEAGHEVVLYTGRRGEYLKEAIELCKANGIVFTEVVEKYLADIYIDDRAIRPEEIF